MNIQEALEILEEATTLSSYENLATVVKNFSKDDFHELEDRLKDDRQFERKFKKTTTDMIDLLRLIVFKR